MDQSNKFVRGDVKQFHPNIWPPFTQIAISPKPKRVIKAIDALLIVDGEPPLIDAISSWWVTLHGHANKEIADSISSQANELEQVIFADFTHPQAEHISARLSEKTGLERLFFSDNGSTAVEVAIKIACQYWHNQGEFRQNIVAFEGAYHGDTFGAMAVGERNLFNAPFEKMLFPVKRIPWPSTWWGDDEVEIREKNVLQKLEQSLDKDTAAVILEPLVQGAGGMSMVRKEFLNKVGKIVNQAGVLLIVDEVLTGFGRCGSLFAFQKTDLKPDLIALSKGLTGGFLPMGATMVKEEIFNAFIGTNPNLTFWHGHSFTANPLGCAAANASLDILEKNPNSFKKFEELHIFHMNKLAKHPKVSRPRVQGTIAAFDLNVQGKKGYLNSAGKAIKDNALKNGVFLRPLGNVVYLLPPLCLNESQLEKCYFAIETGLNQL